MLKILLGPLMAALLVLVTAPLADAQSSYKIRSGDTLQLEVLEDSTLNRSLLVLPDGTVSVPLVGSVPAAGRSVDELRAALATGLAPNFATKPTVYLSVGQLALRAASTGTGSSGMSVFAMGEIAKPGKVSIAPGTTLLQFLAESGGLTKFAATKRVQLRRTDRATGQEKVYLFNYQAVMSGAQTTSITLQSGDVIIVPQRRLFE
jgi:polysaccharide export outer membrane protein